MSAQNTGTVTPAMTIDDAMTALCVARGAEARAAALSDLMNATAAELQCIQPAAGTVALLMEIATNACAAANEGNAKAEADSLNQLRERLERAVATPSKPSEPGADGLHRTAVDHAHELLRRRMYHRDGDFFINVNRIGAEALHVSTVAIIVQAALIVARGAAAPEAPEPQAWRSHDNTGMRHPEECDLSGGATDCEIAAPEAPGPVAGASAVQQAVTDLAECMRLHDAGDREALREHIDVALYDQRLRAHGEGFSDGLRYGAAAPHTAQAEPTTGYVQPVPEHCDRITWRGHYYHLPLDTAQTETAEELCRAAARELSHAADKAAAKATGSTS